MVMVQTPFNAPSTLELSNVAYSIVISVFAIVILSTIGILFQVSHHSMMAHDDDPANGPAVAATVFGAVAIYGVCSNPASIGLGSPCGNANLKTKLYGRHLLCSVDYKLGYI